MFYPCDYYGFSVPVVLRSKAQCEGNGCSLDNCSCVDLLPSIHGHIDEHWNAAAKHHRDALWVSLSTSTDCVAPLDKGTAIACEARLDNCSCVVLLPSIHGHIAVNVDKLTERAHSHGLEHKS